MSSSPSSRVPKSQVPKQASRRPRPLVPVPLLYTAHLMSEYSSKLFCYTSPVLFWRLRIILIRYIVTWIVISLKQVTNEFYFSIWLEHLKKIVFPLHVETTDHYFNDTAIESEYRKRETLACFDIPPFRIISVLIALIRVKEKIYIKQKKVYLKEHIKEYCLCPWNRLTNLSKKYAVKKTLSH